MSREVNVYEAKTRLSALLTAVEQGEDVVIARNGRPVARLVPYARRSQDRHPGGWRGRIHVRDDIDTADDVAEWYDGPVFPG